MAAPHVIEGTEYLTSQDEGQVSDGNFENRNEKQQFVESLKVLSPDDPLMKRFQDALKAHLIRVNERLSDEYHELTIESKRAEKERIQKGNEMYTAQVEITNQVKLIEKWRMSLETIKSLREQEKNNAVSMKETRTALQQEFKTQNQKAASLSHEIENMTSLYRHMVKYENELTNHLAIAKRMSEKDASVQRELIRQKQEMDYIMLKASEMVWKLESELKDLQRQIELKNDEKMTINQTIADADADLQLLEHEQKNLINSWNKVIFSIQQRDKVYDELSTQCMNMRESVKNVNARIEKVKKDTKKEMEENEQLAAIQYKFNEEILCNEEAIKTQNDKYQIIQYKTDSMMKLIEHTEAQFDVATAEHQRLIHEKSILDRELEKLLTQKTVLEDEVMTKLEDKMAQNKILKHLSKLLRDTRETIRRFELSMLQTENQYGKCLLEVKKLDNAVSIEKSELMELDHINNEKNSELNKLNNEIEKYNLLIERKQKKIGVLNKKIDEIKAHASGNGVDMVAPHLIKIASLEKNIKELEMKNSENQRYWLRQEAVIVNLTDERNGKLQEINRLSKQIIIIQQKTLKLENALDKEHKTEQNINRRMNELHQRLLKTNTTVVEQREISDQLQDKNFIAKDEYTRTLQHAERELINLQNKIKILTNEKYILNEKLRDENHNNLSWDKKLKFAIETTKAIKQEQNPGSDVTIMRSEIRKMEMRFSYLKKVQEKMIKDMEHCVTRREMIVNAALTKQIKNPKSMHNKQVMFEKRMESHRMEIKQINKMTKSIENETSKLKNEYELLQCEENENNKLLKNYQNEIIELDKQIVEGEIMKHHKLECLVRKQRKIKLLQRIRDKKYKVICKSAETLNDEYDNQRQLNNDLIEIMEQTNQDFPMFKDDITKTLLTLQLN